jgi:hypothetical protein
MRGADKGRRKGVKPQIRTEWLGTKAFSSFYVQGVYHPVEKVEDEIRLLRCGVFLALTLHAFEAADKAFCFVPIFSRFYGEHVRFAVFVFKLDISQELFGYLDPEDGIQAGLGAVFL